MELAKAASTPHLKHPHQWFSAQNKAGYFYFFKGIFLLVHLAPFLYLLTELPQLSLSLCPHQLSFPPASALRSCPDRMAVVHTSAE